MTDVLLDLLFARVAPKIGAAVLVLGGIVWLIVEVTAVRRRARRPTFPAD